MTIHQVELNWIHHLQKALRSPLTDTFFIYWDYVDSAWFILIFVATIMYFFNRKEGISLLFIFIISGIVNVLLKKYFEIPRPCHIDPSVGIICYQSFAFPSGAAQTAAIIVGIAYAKCRQNITKIIAGLFALFLCFSRVYLGLHYFTDILAGIVVGIGLVILYLKLFPLLEKHWTKFAFGLSVLCLALGGMKMLPQAAMILGIGVGLWLGKNNTLSHSKQIRILTLFVVIIGSSGLLYLGETFPYIKPLATLFAGFWFTYLGSYLISACCNQPRVL